ncbi:uncharacterized protein [Watersipora subatra]|uniref:uncharacterized protein n=1 Tax=Watersipora subatra TaxID=2589382 RepID=UPI00355B27A8
MAYNYKIIYTPWAKLVLADALSRPPLSVAEVEGDADLVESLVVCELVDSLAISPNRLERIKASLLEDAAGMRLLKYIAEGWPQYKDVDPTVRSFYTFKDFLSVVQGIVFYNSRVFIPELERQSVLASVHKGHQGETKCIRRAVELVWWPGMTTEIRELVKTCPECAEFRRRPRELMMCAELPERPWLRLAVDIMEKESRSY